MTSVVSIGVVQDMTWFLREDGKTWQFTADSAAGLFGLILLGEGSGYFPEAYDGQSRIEALGGFEDLEAAKICVMRRLKMYANRHSKKMEKTRKSLMSMINARN